MSKNNSWKKSDRRRFSRGAGLFLDGFFPGRNDGRSRSRFGFGLWRSHFDLACLAVGGLADGWFAGRGFRRFFRR
jgi:hypothetical protein